MRGARLARFAVLALAYVFSSSWIGLNGTPVLLGDFAGRLEFFVDVWADSLWADAVFVLGTLAAGWACVELVRRVHVAAGVVGGAAANWLVYTFSYSLLEGMQHPDYTRLGESALFVADWGWPGLIFASIAPAAYLWWRANRDPTDSPAEGHEVRFEG